MHKCWYWPLQKYALMQDLGHFLSDLNLNTVSGPVWCSFLCLNKTLFFFFPWGAPSDVYIEYGLFLHDTMAPPSLHPQWQEYTWLAATSHFPICQLLCCSKRAVTTVSHLTSEDIANAATIFLTASLLLEKVGVVWHGTYQPSHKRSCPHAPSLLLSGLSFWLQPGILFTSRLVLSLHPPLPHPAPALPPDLGQPHVRPCHQWCQWGS